MRDLSGEALKNINYLNEHEFNILYEDLRELERMLVAFIKKIKDRNKP